MTHLLYIYGYEYLILMVFFFIWDIFRIGIQIEFRVVITVHISIYNIKISKKKKKTRRPNDDNSLLRS